MSSPATTPLTYNGFVTQLCVLAVEPVQTVNGVVTPGNDQLAALIPQVLNYAELRIQRDMSLQNLKETNTSYALTTGSNVLTISANDFVTVETLTLQVGTARIPLLPTTREFLENVYGDTSYTAVPTFYAAVGGDAETFGTTSTLYRVGPCPDQDYPVVISGLVRMPTLNNYATTEEAGTGLTLISTYFPDMLLLAGMIWITAFQRNFGNAQNDPQMGVTYETQYQALLASARTEEGRKRFEGSAWSAKALPAAATPGR
jgi:hypothetical protein